MRPSGTGKRFVGSAGLAAGHEADVTLPGEWGVGKGESVVVIRPTLVNGGRRCNLGWPRWNLVGPPNLSNSNPNPGRRCLIEVLGFRLTESNRWEMQYASLGSVDRHSARPTSRAPKKTQPLLLRFIC